MAEHPASECDLLDDIATKAVLAIVDRYCAQAGIPSYTALADARIADIERASAALMDEAHRSMEAELRRLRVAHGIVANGMRTALAALERGDILAVDDLLTEAVGTALVHARPHHTPAIYPVNVIPLGTALLARRAREAGRL